MSANFHFWHHLTAPEIAALAGKSVAIIPIASTEQHGPHMPVGTDTILNDLMQRGLAENPPEKGTFIVLPTLALGCSEHHVPFNGTYTLPPILYTQVLVAAARSLIKQGHNRIFFLNSHGGNIPSMNTALAELAPECTEKQVLVGGASYWALCGARWREEVPMKMPFMGHACEIEASLCMVARPDLKLRPLPEGAPYPGYLREGWGMAATFAAMTYQGHLGYPQEASVEKGEALFKIAVEVLRKFFADFSELPLTADLRTLQQQ